MRERKKNPSHTKHQMHSEICKSFCMACVSIKLYATLVYHKFLFQRNHDCTAHIYLMQMLAFTWNFEIISCFWFSIESNWICRNARVFLNRFCPCSSDFIRLKYNCKFSFWLSDQHWFFLKKYSLNLSARDKWSNDTCPFQWTT